MKLMCWGVSLAAGTALMMGRCQDTSGSQKVFCQNPTELGEISSLLSFVFSIMTPADMFLPVYKYL